jgi:hypothetical protein
MQHEGRREPASSQHMRRDIVTHRSGRGRRLARRPGKPDYHALIRTGGLRPVASVPVRPPIVEPQNGGRVRAEACVNVFA